MVYIHQKHMGPYCSILDQKKLNGDIETYKRKTIMVEYNDKR